MIPLKSILIKHVTLGERNDKEYSIKKYYYTCKNDAHTFGCCIHVRLI